MRLSSTSSQRTYRYLRIAIVGAAVVLGIGIVAVTVSDGPITSISGMYYTSGRTIFVGSMCAIALGLVALSGRSVEQVLLDVAAVFAALIAVVPTPVGAGDVPGPAPACAVGATVCVPPAEFAGARTGIIVLAIVAVLGAITAIVLARVQHSVTPGVLIGAAAAVAVAAGLVVWLGVAPHGLLGIGHLVATGVFFGLMVAVAIVSAITAPRISHPRWRYVYTAVAVGMVACLSYLAGVEFARLNGADVMGQPWVLVGEVGLVALFAVFWIAQTVQKWDETDPSILPKR